MSKNEILVKTGLGVYTSPVCDSGSDDVPDFGYYTIKDENGNEVEEFGVVGYHSQSAYINSFVDQVDLKKLLERFNAGDGQALNVKTGEYVDVSNVPTSFVDAFNLIKNSQELYNKLPDEVKAQLKDDPMFAAYGIPVKEEVQSTKDEVAELKAQIEELKKGGVKYE